jgi:hypothetical protein
MSAPGAAGSEQAANNTSKLASVVLIAVLLTKVLFNPTRGGADAGMG